MSSVKTDRQVQNVQHLFIMAENY